MNACDACGKQLPLDKSKQFFFNDKKFCDTKCIAQERRRIQAEALERRLVKE